MLRLRKSRTIACCWRLPKPRRRCIALRGVSADWLEKFHAVKADGPEDSAILNTYLNVANRYVSRGSTTKRSR